MSIPISFALVTLSIIALDVIANNQNGILVETENATDWQKKVTTVLSDDFDRTAFGKNAQKYIIENLDWEKIAKMYYDILKNI